MQAYQKGKLISWNDDRGFGFIEPEHGSQNVFLHISALKKHGRRPQKGDIISYQLSVDAQNRVQAARAYIEGVRYQTRIAKPSSTRQIHSARTSAFQQYKPRKQSSRSRSRLVPVLVAIIVIIGMYWLSKHQGFRTHHSSTAVQSGSFSLKSETYQCEGKTRCSEMRSCEEAMFYLKNCPGVEMDGDGDGIPCERQWCGK